MTTFSCDANLFRIVAGFVSSEATRYYLNGVAVQPHPVEGVYLVATDGHRLFAAWDPQGHTDAPEHTPLIVRLGAGALKASKATWKDDGRRVLSGETGKPAAVTLNSATLALEPDWQIDGQFPDWRRVLPGNLTGNETPWPVSGTYLADFGRAARELPKNDGTPHMSKWAGGTIVLAHGKDGGPSLITFPDFAFAFGVLMPRRDGKVETAIPGWVNARPATKVAAE